MKGRELLKRALILINAYSRLQTSLNQSVRLQEEFDKLGVKIDIKRNNIDTAMIINGDPVSFVMDYDFVVYLDKDKYVSALLEKAGIRVFNRHDAIRLCDDKMNTHIKLSGHGVNMPDTIPGLLCYNREAPISEAMQRVELIESKLGYPCIVKESYGSLGQHVYCANNRDELLALMEKVKCKAHLFQEMIVGSKGRDVRVIVIGGKVICSMLRVSNTDFRSNIELGGIGQQFDLPQSFKEISEKVADVLMLDYCGIDLLFGENGQPMICEVNSNAFFGAIENVSGINVASVYAKYMYDTIYKD